MACLLAGPWAMYYVDHQLFFFLHILFIDEGRHNRDVSSQADLYMIFYMLPKLMSENADFIWSCMI